jgi:hypothetical protein
MGEEGVGEETLYSSSLPVEYDQANPKISLLSQKVAG